MSKAELACVYATLLLHDCGKDINAQNLQTVTKAANVELDSLWASVFAKYVNNDTLESLIERLTKPGAAPVSAAPQEEKKEEKPKEEEKEEKKEEEEEEGMLFNTIFNK